MEVSFKQLTWEAGGVSSWRSRDSAPCPTVANERAENNQLSCQLT